MSIEYLILLMGILGVIAFIASIGFSLYIMYQVGNKLDKDDEQ